MPKRRKHGRHIKPGLRVGKIVFVERSPRPEKQKPNSYWLCKCDCGTEVVLLAALASRQKSCGCEKYQLHPRNPDGTRKAKKDRAGEKHNMLTVIKQCAPPERIIRLTKAKGEDVSNIAPYWLCKCDCGNTKVVHGSRLYSGGTKSCGCLIKLNGRNAKRGINPTYLQDGKRHPAYPAWASIRYSLHGKNIDWNWWQRQKDAGVRVMCKRWLTSVEDFIKDVGDRPSKDHTLTLVDITKDYEPGNLVWAIKKIRTIDREQDGNGGSRGYRGVKLDEST